MAQFHKLGFESEIKCSAEKFFGMFSHNVSQLPKYLPHTYINIEVIVKGDETFISLKHAGDETSDVWIDKLTSSIHKENRSIIYEIIEGKIMNCYKVLSLKLDVVPRQCADRNASLVTWSLEFEKVNEDSIIQLVILICSN
ncbi:hypothetical protein MKX01_008871 [Papaver californicum]|nr:hypothetical protein MKX01_008871 [Papaver californicum]